MKKKRTARVRGARGFTLVESMIASAVLAAGAAAMLTSYFTLMGIAEHQRRLSAAVHVTKGKVEELIAARPPSTLLLAGSGPVFVDALGLPSGSTLNGKNYRVDWSFVHDVPVDGQMRIDIVTSWLERGRIRTTRFSTGRSE